MDQLNQFFFKTPTAASPDTGLVEYQETGGHKKEPLEYALSALAGRFDNERDIHFIPVSLLTP